MPVPKVPPYEVNIFLRFRFSSQRRPCSFSRARSANYQLDIELDRVVGQCGDIQVAEDLFHEPIGFIVDGRLYTDDEPYWECMLVENQTYEVAYLQQSFGLGFLRLYDFLFRVPVFPAEEVPAPDPKNCTSTRRAVLISHGLIPALESRANRRTLSDNADREYGAWKTLIVPRGQSSYSQRMRRIVPGVPEIDYDAIVEFACGGGVDRFLGSDISPCK